MKVHSNLEMKTQAIMRLAKDESRPVGMKSEAGLIKKAESKFGLLELFY